MQRYPPLLRKLLENRGIKTSEEAEAFLNLDYERDIHDPFLLPDMDKAVERILEAIKNKEKIVIYSDYDADGIPGAVVLHDFFKKIKYENFANYIPHRHLEGFGLNSEAIEKFQADKVKLIITVDCGIADIEEVDEARKHGIDVIISDHHEPPRLAKPRHPSLEKTGKGEDDLPDCVAVIDAKRADSKYPFRELCGAGVAFKLVQAILIQLKSPKYLSHLTQTNRSKDTSKSSAGDVSENLLKINDGWEKWLLDMVAVATLSDMVSLVGENRALAFYGLKVLRKSPRVGLMKLLSLLRVEQKNLTEDDVGFSISPRINAASRMGNPEDAFRLFVAETDEEADICARHLDHINNERKGTVAGIVKEVRKIMKERYSPESASEVGVIKEKRVIVIGNPDWKPSLLGLVANSLVDDHSCPVFLWGRDGGNILKGSCRGDGCVSTLDLMKEVESGIFIEYGGHDMSGGFSVFQEKIHLLEEKLQLAYEKVVIANSVSSKSHSDEVRVDAKITLDEVNSDNYKLIEKLAPFGAGNPKPLFLFEKVEVKNVKIFGKEANHLELAFQNSKGKTIKAIGFFMSSFVNNVEIKEGDRVNLLANFEKSTFRGFAELRLRIVDISKLETR
jgi:single-stranded-DNA-specific exonuclease